MPKSEPKPAKDQKTAPPKNGQKPGSMGPGILQSQACRFADDYVARMAQAADDFAARSTNASLRISALRWKLSQAMAAYINASGQNPVVNNIDMVVLATASRMVAEKFAPRWGTEAYSDVLIDMHRRLETNAWELLEGVIPDAQKDELRQLIQNWHEQNPDQRNPTTVRFREFLETTAAVPKKGPGKPTSIFDLLFIDPMAGLDPAARAIEETRQSAERIMYYGQRVPLLLTWQAEFLTLQLADQPAARQLLEDLDRVSKSTEVFATTAEGLPKLVDQQREAAIKQIFEGIAVERTNLISSLSSEEEKIKGLLTEARGTLDAGNRMATSLDGAIKSLDTFIRYVSPPPDTNAPPPPVSTNSRPFDILDYGKTATQVGTMALDLQTMINSVNQTLPQAGKLGEQAQGNARQVVDHAFKLGLVFCMVFFAGAIGAALIYRMLAAKLFNRPPAGNSPSKRPGDS
jgi:hypothetical protein